MLLPASLNMLPPRATAGGIAAGKFDLEAITDRGFGILPGGGAGTCGSARICIFRVLQQLCRTGWLLN
jgi:hypothetical protein